MIISCLFQCQAVLVHATHVIDTDNRRSGGLYLRCAKSQTSFALFPCPSPAFNALPRPPFHLRPLPPLPLPLPPARAPEPCAQLAS